MIRKQNPEKNVRKIRVSNSVNQKLWNLDGAASEIQVEVLKRLGICHGILLLLHAIERKLETLLKY